MPSLFVDQTDFIAERCQPQVSVILPQDQTVFRARSHHPVWIGAAFGYEVINQCADIGGSTV